MKIGSGTLKGKKIRFDRSKRRLRPTPSKVREAMFHIIAQDIPESRFLDLYAGSGALGLEALSHGASEIFFVETNRSYTKNIRHAVEQSGLREKTKIIAKKVLPFIQWAEANKMVFDIIFLDPPYHTEEIMDALSAIGRSHILRQGGLVIAEHFRKRVLPEQVNSLRKKRDYTYGDTVLSFYSLS
jgi:16S rRNA (guanine(966)-N(2))-methyltransferase RsmD